MVVPFVAKTADTACQAADPIASWNEASTEKAVFSFAEKKADEGSTSFARPAERTAAFDSDGTLWGAKNSSARDPDAGVSRDC